MELEIERKFLVTTLPSDLAEHPRSGLRQGYLAITEEGVEVRVRAAGDEYTLTVKSAGELVRTEVGVPITAAQFEALWPLTAGRRIEKQRTRYPLGSLVADVDVYEGDLAPLQILEVEFTSLEDSRAFEPPAWLGMEVTDDLRYKNKNLALAGGSQAFHSSFTAG